MKIHLGRVVDEPLDWQATLAFEAAELGHPDLLAVSEISCRGRLTPTFPDHVLQAALSYNQTLRCNRCLVSHDMAMSLDMALVVRVREELVSGAVEEELGEEDFGILHVPEPEFDLRPLVVEQLHLGIPMKPLCREDCAGLCSQCGVDLNQGACTCQVDVDPRWAALKNFT